MQKRLAVVGAILVVAAVIALLSSTESDQNNAEFSGNYTDISEFSARQEVDTVELVIKTNGVIPSEPNNPEFSEDFGYGWFGQSNDHFMRGSDHLVGYIVYTKDSTFVSSSVNFFQVPKSDIFCSNQNIENNGKVSLKENSLMVMIDVSQNNIAHSVVQIIPNSIEKAVSFMVVSDPRCHGNMGIEIINSKGPI